MSVRRRNGSWVIDIVFWRNGRRNRIRKTVGNVSKSEALALERQERSRLEVSLKLNIVVPRFDEFAEEFIETYAVTNNKPSEVESKRTIIEKHLVPFFGEFRLDAIGPQQFEKFKAKQVAAGLAPKTINNQLTVLHRIFTVAKEWGRLATVPSMRWLPTPLPEFDFLTFEEAARLLDAAEREWRPMILVALRTGLRHGELLALRWDDVDLVTGRLNVRRAVARGIVGTPKSGKGRELPLSPETVAVLKELPSRFAGGLVFPDRRGHMLTRGECRRPLWRACHQAGIRRIGWHVLRHTFASHLAMKGVAIKAIQELLGHSTLEITLRYSHLSPDIRRDAVTLLDTPVTVIKERMVS